MIKNVYNLTESRFDKGLNTSKNIFNLQPGHSPEIIDAEYNNDASVSRRYGTSTMNTTAMQTTGGYGMFDFRVRAPAPVLLLHCDGNDGDTNFIDSSPNEYVITASGNAQMDTDVKKFGQSSLKVVYGSGDFLELADNDDWHFSDNDFTIDCQASLLNLPRVGSIASMVSQFVDTNNYWNFGVQHNAGGPRLRFIVVDNGVAWIDMEQTMTIDTSTLYHFAVVRSSNYFMLFQDGSLLGSATENTGSVPNLSGPLRIGTRQPNNHQYDGWLDEIRIVKGSPWWNAAFTAPTEAYSTSILDRLLCSSGTGIYYSTDVGKTWAVCQTSRSSVLNNFAFVKNWAINCNDDYEAPQYWAGTAGTYFANISTAAPLCRFPASFQGFFFLINEKYNKRSVYYIDENDMFTSTYSNFQLPTERSDELNGAFQIGRNFYIPSKYRIFRLTYVGGNPDWTYHQIKDWGFVPRTFKVVIMPEIGEVVVGLDYAKNIRIFDGVNDEIISDNIKYDNGMTKFYLDNINDAEIEKCWAEDDRSKNTYKLHVVYASSSTVSYSINFNYRVGALFPYQNQVFQSGVLAEDTGGKLHMLACDYDGYVHHLDSGNTDITAGIDGQYASPFLYNKSPVNVQKAQQVNLYFSVTSSGTLYLEDRSQFSNVWNLNKEFSLGSAISSVQIRQTVDVPEHVNVYQYKISNSANTAEPWQLNLADYSGLEIGMGKA